MHDEMKAADRHEVPHVCHGHKLNYTRSGSVKVYTSVVEEDAKKAPRRSVKCLQNNPS